MTTIAVVGPGRAGRSFATAWSSVGFDVELVERSAPVESVAHRHDVVLIATPDQVIASVAQSVTPGRAVVLHCSGATTLGPLRHHARHGSIHPLMALPDPATGAARLCADGWFAVSGDPMATELAIALGGRTFEVGDDDRALYHATAAVSANHLVALLGQVERLADRVGVPTEAFFDLARGSFDDVVANGAAASLTGPAARGDQQTLAAHREVLPADELVLYDTLVAAAQKLAKVEPGPLIDDHETEGPACT